MRYGLGLAHVMAAAFWSAAPGCATAQTGLVALPPPAAAHSDALSQQPSRSSVQGAPSAPDEQDLEARQREETILWRLSARGIVNIRAWRREGTVFRAVAEWYGEIIDLQVDVATGEVRQPERMKGKQVENMLRQQGWGPVKEVKRGGDTFIVHAERGGQVFELRIHAKTGQIHETR